MQALYSRGVLFFDQFQCVDVDEGPAPASHLPVLIAQSARGRQEPTMLQVRTAKTVRSLELPARLPDTPPLQGRFLDIVAVKSVLQRTGRPIRVRTEMVSELRPKADNAMVRIRNPSQARNVPCGFIGVPDRRFGTAKPPGEKQAARESPTCDSQPLRGFANHVDQQSQRTQGC